MLLLFLSCEPEVSQFSASSCPPIFVLFVWSHMNTDILTRSSLRLFSNFFKNRKEIAFEKETNFAPLLLAHQKLHKCRKEWGGGFQKWLHCDICPWCITESVSLRRCTIGRRIKWKECTASNILWCCPESFYSWGVYLFFPGAVETSCVIYVSVCMCIISLNNPESMTHTVIHNIYIYK